MITLEDLQSAIAECQGVRNPNANTCIKLAAYLTIREHLYGGKPDISGISYAASPEFQPGTVSAVSNSEFSAAIDGKDEEKILRIMDELMDAVSVLNPRLYAATLRKLNEI